MRKYTLKIAWNSYELFNIMLRIVEKLMYNDWVDARGFRVFSISGSAPVEFSSRVSTYTRTFDEIRNASLSPK